MYSFSAPNGQLIAVFGSCHLLYMPPIICTRYTSPTTTPAPHNYPKKWFPSIISYIISFFTCLPHSLQILLTRYFRRPYHRGTYSWLSIKIENVRCKYDQLSVLHSTKFRSFLIEGPGKNEKKEDNLQGLRRYFRLGPLKKIGISLFLVTRGGLCIAYALPMHWRHHERYSLNVVAVV